MVVHALQCLNCDESRIGRETAEGVTPVQKRCPDCGATGYLVLASKQIHDAADEVRSL